MNLLIEVEVAFLRGFYFSSSGDVGDFGDFGSILLLEILLVYSLAHYQ
jgi:hypothetical protein